MIKFIKVRNVKTPTRANNTDSWIDFFIPDDLREIKVTPTDIFLNYERKEDWVFEIIPWKWVLVPSGIKMIIPTWFDLVFDNKSWVAVKKWLIIWAKVVDSSYRWEVHLHLLNIWTRPITIFPWEKIAQWIVRKVELCSLDEISAEEFEKENNTERWNGWFWSTWNK